jgi:hypothetical protein
LDTKTTFLSLEEIFSTVFKKVLYDCFTFKNQKFVKQFENAVNFMCRVSNMQFLNCYFKDSKGSTITDYHFLPYARFVQERKVSKDISKFIFPPILGC